MVDSPEKNGEEIPSQPGQSGSQGNEQPTVPTPPVPPTMGTNASANSSGATPQPYPQGQAPQPYVPGQAPQPYPQGQAPQPYAPGQAPQPYPQGQAPQPYPQGQAPQPYVPGQAPQPYPQGQAPQPYPQGQAPQPYPQGQAPQPYPQGQQHQQHAAGDSLKEFFLTLGRIFKKAPVPAVASATEKPLMWLWSLLFYGLFNGLGLSLLIASGAYAAVGFLDKYSYGLSPYDSGDVFVVWIKSFLLITIFFAVIAVIRAALNMWAAAMRHGRIGFTKALSVVCISNGWMSIWLFAGLLLSTLLSNSVPATMVILFIFMMGLPAASLLAELLMYMSTQKLAKPTGSMLIPYAALTPIMAIAVVIVSLVITALIS